MVSSESKQEAEITGTSRCCGAEIIHGFCEMCMEHAEACDKCGGTGKINGKRCFECNDYDDYDGQLEEPLK